MTTQEQIDFINNRDAMQRASQGTAELVTAEVVSEPTGRIWWPNEKKGPLDGMPEQKHYFVAKYADGTGVKFDGVKNSKIRHTAMRTVHNQAYGANNA